MTKERASVNPADCWDLSPLYPSCNAWDLDYAKFQEKMNTLSSFKGRLHEGVSVCFEVVKTFLDLDRWISKLYTYAHLKHDEDTAQPAFKEAYGRIRLLAFDFGREASWIEPELLQLDEKTIEDLLKDPSMEPYRFYIEKIIRLKPYTLSADKEELMALAAKPLNSSQQIFSAYNNTDIVFPKIRDEKEAELPLSHGLFQLYMQSKDRTLRKQAFDAMHERYKQLENTITEVLQSHIQSHLFQARARNYKSCMQGTLFANQIDEKVYHNLIDTVSSYAEVMHEYVSFRKEYFKLDEVHAYDMYVSCSPEIDMHLDFDTAVDKIIESVAVLGPEYQSTLAKGLKKDRWVDRYENARKRSGAYSSGCYDSPPYILMNYQGSISDVFTLAHEAGHSMHSFLSHKNQPYQYSGYTIFLAEVASTFNEELLFRYLLSQAQSSQERVFLINKKIDGIRATLFRQTLFAEFELAIHTTAERGEVLTPATCRKLYKDLNRKYYGEDFCVDDLVEYEFLRIPHFYSNFYVYQYATGISAAQALVEKVVSTDNPKPYLDFLSGGSSDYPLTLLKNAGVDMTTQEPVLLLIKEFSRLVSELKKELGIESKEGKELLKKES